MNNQKNNKIKIIKNNSEILFIYDARMCNPNGDPDDENKPRMDYNRDINLVSDVRLKRYIRDYLMDYKEKTIFVSKVNNANVLPKGRLEILLNNENKKIDLKKIKREDINWLLDQLPDVRLFGAIIPDCNFEEGGNATFTGPVQFNWGYSLNKVTGPMESSGITSHFKTGEKKVTGAMGKDYRVAYSLIAFHGIISAKRAEHTHLTEDDTELFDNAMINAIPLEASTRSKTGQCPLLYIRIEYNTPAFFLCDLRRYVKIVDKDGTEMQFGETTKLRSPVDYRLDLTKLSEKLGACNEKIRGIHFWKHEDLDINGWKNQNGKLKINKSEMQIIPLPEQEKKDKNPVKR